ncbi:hypothetical protein B484DRAFT_401720 [Ochromonadaceae sp. CCMP2298]|nr:hypothetical protein B484DRAFT_401720 [Ochromonadaceae sp. CCMP2298]
MARALDQDAPLPSAVELRGAGGKKRKFLVENVAFTRLEEAANAKQGCRRIGTAAIRLGMAAMVTAGLTGSSSLPAVDRQARTPMQARVASMMAAIRKDRAPEGAAEDYQTPQDLLIAYYEEYGETDDEGEEEEQGEGGHMELPAGLRRSRRARTKCIRARAVAPSASAQLLGGPGGPPTDPAEAGRRGALGRQLAGGAAATDAGPPMVNE